MVKNDLEKSVRAACAALGYPETDFVIERPADPAHGDYSTNAALVCAQGAGVSPRELAERLIQALRSKVPVDVERIEVAGPGFVNFRLSREYYSRELARMLAEGDAYGRSGLYAGEKVVVEHTDPNPFKALHIGHLVPNSLGESVARLFECAGAETKRANYSGDVGLHVAKAVWGLVQGKSGLGAAYAFGSARYEEDERARQEIIEMNKKIYEESDPVINELYGNGRAESLERFESVYARLGTPFDYYFFESETGKRGAEIVREHAPEVFEESEGAIVYRGERDGLHTRVFITREGLPTYEAKELGLARIKYERFPYDRSVIIAGAEVSEYFKVARAALARISPDLAEKTIHIASGMLRLSHGKMSSRTGNVIEADDLIDRIKEDVRARAKESGGESKDEQALDAVAVAAIKYWILRQEAGKDIVFDVRRSISFTGDSGPYLQYTHARCRSLLLKGQKEGIRPDPKAPAAPETLAVERELERFPETVHRAARDLAPHYLCAYLRDLAGQFNALYNDVPIADARDEASPYKLAVTRAAAATLARGLHLLGIAAPERM